MSLFSFASHSIHVSSGPSCCLGWFLSISILSAFLPLRFPTLTLTPLYFILASPNLFQSIIQHMVDLVRKVYHRAICNRSGDIAREPPPPPSCPRPPKKTGKLHIWPRSVGPAFLRGSEVVRCVSEEYNRAQSFNNNFEQSTSVGI